MYIMPPLIVSVYWMLIFTSLHHHHHHHHDHHPAVVAAGRGMPLAAGDHHQQLRHVRALPADYYSDASASGGYPKEGNYEANQINTAAADDSTDARQVNNGGQGLIWTIVSAIVTLCILLARLAYRIILKFYKLKTTPQVPPPAAAASASTTPFNITNNHYTFSGYASMVNNNNPAPPIDLPLLPSPTAPPLVPSPPAPAPTIDLDLDLVLPTLQEV